MRDSSDSLDHATDVEMAFRDSAIAAASAAQKPPADFDGENCVDCGSEIQKERLALNKYTCIKCQQAREFNNRLFRK